MSLTITALPAFKDNYIWALSRPDNPYCVIVDPGSAEPVNAYLHTKQLNLAAILITHHHFDHTAGIQALVKNTSIPVYGPVLETIPGITHPVDQKDKVIIKELTLELAILDVPGHTLGHIAYYAENCLFCGDTLFAGGCGRMFEGTAEQLLASLSSLSALPEETQIYCAHEYTAANLKFALTLEPENKALQARYAAVQLLRAQGANSLPARLGLEKSTNPFLRCSESSIIEAATRLAGYSLKDVVEVFKVIRHAKDHF